MHRKTFLSICLASLAMPASEVRQPGKTVLKFGWTTADSPQDPMAIGAPVFKKALEASS